MIVLKDDSVNVAFMVKDKLIIDGRRYGTADLNKLPVHLRPQNTCTRVTDKHVFFSGRDSPLSNFHASPFTTDGKTFNCMEQYLSYKKAELFKDEDSANQILNETDPGVIKQLGQKVKNFEPRVWHMAKSEIGENSIRCKFEQNANMKD